MKYLRSIQDKNGVFYQVFHFFEAGRGVLYEIRTNGNVRVGSAQYSPGNTSLDGCGIITKWQRRGIASALYDLIQEEQNIELRPSNHCTTMGKAFWKARLEEACE